MPPAAPQIASIGQVIFSAAARDSSSWVRSPVLNDADRLRGEYLRKGFFGVDVRSRVERNKDATTVVYTIEEGVRATPGRDHRLAGRSRAAGREGPRAMPLADGAPFEYETYDLAKIKLLGVVQDAGYAHAKLDATVDGDRANHTAIVSSRSRRARSARSARSRSTASTAI